MKFCFGRRDVPFGLFMPSRMLGLAALITLAATAHADSQKITRANYELAARFSEENLRKMIFDLDVFPSWIDQSNTFWYRWTTSRGTDHYLVDCARKKIEKVFDNSVMAAALSAMFERSFDPAHLTIDTLTFSKDRRSVQFKVDGVPFEFERGTGTLTKLLEKRQAHVGGAAGILPGEWPDYCFSPDRRWGVFARNHNLFVVDLRDPGKREYQLTSDGERWHTFQAEINEDAPLDKAAIPGVYYWLGGSNMFVAERWDRRKVRDMWLLKPLTKPAPTIESYKRTLTGDEHSDQYELWAFDCDKKSAVRIKAERWKDQMLGGKAMDGGIYAPRDSGKLYFMRTDRTWTKIDLAEADPKTGDVRTIIEEELFPHVTPTSRMAKILNKGNDIIWWSDRDGWGHFYLYDGQGRLKNQITSGPFCCRSIIHIDTAGRTLYFTASGKEPGVDPYYENLYRIGFDGTGLACLTPENAHHPAETMSVSPSGEYFVVNQSRVDLVPRAVVRDASGNKVLELAPPDVSRLEAAGWRAPEPFKVKAADNITDLYGVMWKPFDFDPSKKYPIILFTYPGPIMEFVPKDFNPQNIFVTGLSQLGFIVVHIGNRGGGAQRSKWYGTFGYGNIRDFALEDNKHAVEQVADLYPFVDGERVGVMGGSAGGFQSATLMFSYPDFFKVGVSWAGAHDMNILESYWSELNHGVKEIQDKERIRFESEVPTNFELAKNLKGHLLLLHGLQDSRVHPAVFYRLIQALIEAGKPFDMCILPDEQHQFSRGKYLPYILRVMWQYFAQNLMGDPRSKVEAFEKYGGPVLNSMRTQ